MKLTIIYDSIHGHTKKIVDELQATLSVLVDPYRAGSFPDISSYDRIVFCCPTYGDDELSDDMEQFLISIRAKDKKYCLCELGNYYGYEDFQFAPRKIMVPHLNSMGWVEFHEPISIDSLAVIDWIGFRNWARSIDTVLKS